MKRSGILGAVFVMVLALVGVALYNKFSGKNIATLGAGSTAAR